jgi:hypothetical protein
MFIFLSNSRFHEVCFWNVFGQNAICVDILPSFNEFNMSMETFLACNILQLIVNMNIVKLSQNLRGVWKFVHGKHFASRHQGS